MSVKEIMEKYLMEEREWKKQGNDYILQDKDVSDIVSIKKKGAFFVIYVNGTPKSKAKSLDDAKEDAELFIH